MALRLEIVTPEGIVWSDDVKSVVLPTIDGEMGILAGHIPLITKLNAGDLRVEMLNGKTEFLAVDIGFARCMADTVSVLTEAAIKFEDLDDAKIKASKEAAIAALAESHKNKSNASPEEIERLEAVLRFAIVQELAKSKRK